MAPDHQRDRPDRYLLLVMTPNALRSKVVRDEWRYGRQQGRCVIPIMGALELRVVKTFL